MAAPTQGVAAGFTTLPGLCVGTQPGTGPSFPQGSTLSRVKFFNNSSTITPAATATVTAAEQTFAVTGIGANDILIGWTLQTPNVTNLVTIGNMRVSSAGNIGITFVNQTAGSLTFPAITAGNLIFLVMSVDTY